MLVIFLLVPAQKFLVDSEDRFIAMYLAEFGCTNEMGFLRQQHPEIGNAIYEEA